MTVEQDVIVYQSQILLPQLEQEEQIQQIGLVQDVMEVLLIQPSLLI